MKTAAQKYKVSKRISWNKIAKFRRENGLCVRCGKKSKGKRLCKEHMLKQAEHNKNCKWRKLLNVEC